jgi:hypothetical protein
MCGEVTKIKELRNYASFSKDAETFYFIYDFCIKQSLSINSYLDHLENIEDFLYKFKNFTFPFSIIFTDSAKALKLAEELSLEGKIVGDFFVTKVAGKSVHIPKLKVVGNKVYLYTEKLKEFDKDRHIKISNKSLLFFRLLKIFDYKLSNGFEYFIDDNTAFIDKSFFKRIALLSEDLLNIYTNYKQIMEEKKFFLEELSKLLLSAKLSGFRIFNYNLLFVSKDKNIIFYLPEEFPASNFVDTERLNVERLPLELRKQEYIDIENVVLIKFKEIEYFSPHLLRFLKIISGEWGDVVDA